jgi:predicted nucleic acid-binding protein
VLDTSVYIEAMRHEEARGRLEAWQRRRAPHIWLHVVVIAELLAGGGG